MKKLLPLLLGIIIIMSACSGGEETSTPTASPKKDSREPAQYKYTSEIFEIDNPGTAVLYTKEGIYFSKFQDNAENVPIQKTSFLNFKDKSRVLEMAGFTLKPAFGESGEYIYSYYHDFAETNDGNIAMLKHTAITLSTNAEAEPLSEEWLVGSLFFQKDYIVITTKNGEVISENEIKETTEALPTPISEGETEQESTPVYKNTLYSGLALLANGTFVTVSDDNKLVNISSDGNILGEIETKGYPEKLFTIDGSVVITLRKEDITELWTLSGTEFTVKRVYRIPDDCCCLFPGSKGHEILYCTTSPQALLGFSDGDGYSSVAIRFSDVGIDAKSLSVRTEDSGILNGDFYLTAYGENPNSLYIIRIFQERYK